MADVTLKYKGATIGELSETGNKTIETAGKYCEADILLEYVKSGGSGENVTIGKKGTITLSEDVISTTITHGLGKVPFLIIIFPTNNYAVSEMKVVGAWYFNGYFGGVIPFTSNAVGEVGYYAANKQAYSASASSSGAGYYVENVTANTFDFVGTSAGHLPQNVELTWYAVALNDTGG